MVTFQNKKPAKRLVCEVVVFVVFNFHRLRLCIIVSPHSFACICYQYNWFRCLVRCLLRLILLSSLPFHIAITHLNSWPSLAKIYMEKLHKCLLSLRNFFIKFESMKEGYVIRDQSLPHFLTATIVDWVDAFFRKGYRDCVLEWLEFCLLN